MTLESELAPAAAAAREVQLTTFGRKTGRPSRRTIWITTDPSGRVHIRSGQGLKRDWPQNLLANGRAVLRISGTDFAVQARHVTDRDELRASNDAVRAKYGRSFASSQPGEPLTLPEQATFELVASTTSADG